MDNLAREIGIVIGGIAGATFLWIGLRVLIEGERRAEVTPALATATLAMASYIYGELIAELYPGWAIVEDRLWWWTAGAASVGWYAMAAYHIGPLLSPARRRWLRRGLLGFGVWAFAQAAVGSLWPQVFIVSTRLPSDSQPHYQGTIFYAFSIAQIQAPLWAALLIYLRVRRRVRGRGLLRWFTPASVCAIASALLFETQIALAEQAGNWAPLIGGMGMLTLLACASFLLGGITTNRRLLGRPIGTRDLFVRWSVLLSILIAGVVMLGWSGLAERQVDFVALIILTPVVSAAFDWNGQRIYKRSIEQSRRLIHASLSSWPLFDPQICRAQAQNLLHALADELSADSCYVRLQANAADEPFVLHSGKLQLKQSVSPPKGSDARMLEVNGQRLGFIALRGPNGIPYSTLELDLAEACGYSIAGLYLDSRQAQSLDTLIVRREHEREEHNHTLQRVLHDRVMGNLDAILKAVMLLPDPNDDLADEIREAALDSMLNIRGLLRAELVELYPTTLFRKGLLAALQLDLLPQHQNRRFGQASITLDADGLDDAMLDAYLTQDLKRTLYGALDEAIRNATKYAGGEQHHAIKIDIRLSVTHIGLLAEVDDNGVGFVPALASPEGDGLGLRYHQAVLRLAGGTMTVNSQPGRGTKVHIHLPLVLLNDLSSKHGPGRPASQIAHSGIEWRRLTLETERHPSGRYLINDDLSDLTRTHEVIEQQARRRIADQQQLQQLIAIDHQRQQNFERYVQHHSFKELVDRQRLVRYISTGKTDEGFEGVGVEPAHQHVRKVIRLLRENDNYHLALSDERFESNFAVKPGYAVLLEKRAVDGQGRIEGIYAGIRDTDPSTVASFTRRFEEAWSAVPLVYRDKRQVIGWLEARLAEAASGALDTVTDEEAEEFTFREVCSSQRIAEHR